jgi:hypothetical protein
MVTLGRSSFKLSKLALNLPPNIVEHYLTDILYNQENLQSSIGIVENAER